MSDEPLPTPCLPSMEKSQAIESLRHQDAFKVLVGELRLDVAYEIAQIGRITGQEQLATQALRIYTATEFLNQFITVE